MSPLRGPLHRFKNLLTSRPDGELLEDLHPYRRMMPYIMPTRNGSVVYFDYYVRAEEMLRFIEAHRERGVLEIGPTHVVLAACLRGFALNQNLNQFVSGQRLYQRNETWITFSMKRKKQDAKSKIAVVKRQFLQGDGPETFVDVCDKINKRIKVERSDKKTYLDKELDLLGLIPGSVMRVAVKGVRALDYVGLLPKSFIDGDGMYTSMFIANLGSVGMDPGYHHLYEWGNCPLFLMVGKVQDRPYVDEDGEVKAGKFLHLRYSYDERIDDGLSARFGMDAAAEALEDPFGQIGCLQDDGSDHYDLAANDRD